MENNIFSFTADTAGERIDALLARNVADLSRSAAQRLLELTDAFRNHRIEPKRIRMVYAKADRAPYLVLLEGMKNAKPGLLWMPPLVVYEPDGTETAEIDRIYHRTV